LYIHENILDNRLHYRYTPPPLSMIDNFNAALELVTGEYLCIIGDDDGVNPEIIEATAWAKDNDLDALSSRFSPPYFWKNTGFSSSIFSEFKGGELHIRDFSGKIFVADVEREVYKLIRNGGVYYHSFLIPKLYHGIVRRRCLEDIRDKIGCYFGGLSPDIFSALAISEIAKNTIFIDYPLTIDGICPDSGSTYKKRRKFGGSVEDTFLMRNRGEYQWSPLVPRVYCAETIWVDSGIAALRAMGRNDIIQELNLTKLAAYCIGGNRGILGCVVRDLLTALRITGKNPVSGVFQFIFALITNSAVKLLRRIWNRFMIILGKRGSKRIDGLEDMIEASHALTNYLKDNGRRFHDIFTSKANDDRIRKKYINSACDSLPLNKKCN
jgi:hypothetical protein